MIGAGETAAAIAVALAQAVAPSTTIEIVTRHPILFTRNEHWMEVFFFSTAHDWQALSREKRLEVIRHADRGTFSVAAKRFLDTVHNITLRVSDATEVSRDGAGLLFVHGRGEGPHEPYDFVVDARGNDPYSFLGLFAEAAVLGNPGSLPDRIRADLSVEGIEPPLHLPGLAALQQGPGFPNLSCLGLLADRILGRYVRPPGPS